MNNAITIANIPHPLKDLARRWVTSEPRTKAERNSAVMAEIGRHGLRKLALLRDEARDLCELAAEHGRIALRRG